MTTEMIGAFVVVFARAAAFFYIAPIIGDKNVPPKYRVAIAALVAMSLAPLRGPVDVNELPLLLPGELLVGAAAGFAGRLILAGVEAGGQLIALNFGLGLANTFDPNLGESAVVTRRLAFVIASLAFIVAGGLEACVRIVAAPPVTASTAAGALVRIISVSGDVLVIAIKFAAPAIVAGLVGNLGIALATKASPALNVFSVMLAAMLVVGGVTLLATAPAFARDIARIGHMVKNTMAQVAGL